MQPGVFRKSPSTAKSRINRKIKLTDLKIEIVLENNESIKNYLQNSSAFAFISISAIHEELKMNKLKIIGVEGVNIERYYYFLHAQGGQNKAARLFQRFVHNTQS